MTGHDEEYEGASPKEQLIEACRRNNPELLKEVLEELGKKMSKEEIGDYLNRITDNWGFFLLHIATKNGSWAALDDLLDVEFLECDPLTRDEKRTPLHLCVQYANDRSPEIGLEMAKMCVDAGADPRVKDFQGRKAHLLINPKRCPELVEFLRLEEYKIEEMGGLGDSARERFRQNQEADEDTDSDGPSGEDEGGMKVR
ncbi:MAG: hypothetical protein Q9227_003712 [Pyrenula ochraceoflavens]